MKKFAQLLVCLIVLFSSLMVAGCNSTKPINESESVEPVTTETQNKIKIGFSVIDISMGYWNEQVQGAQAKADELGIELIVHDSKSDPASQISAIEDWTSQGVNAIVVSAVDPQSLQSYVKAAREKGIVVIAAIHDLEGVNATVKQDEYELGVMTGELAGSWIADNLAQNAEFAVLGYDGLEHVIIRGDGMVDGVKEKAPNANLVARQDCNGVTDMGMQVAESLLQANPDLRVFVAVNDACALGIYEAIKQSGKSLDDFCVVGSDGSEEAFDKIRENGIFRGTIDLNPAGAGALEVEMAYKLINGEDVDESVTVPMQTITFENVPEK